MELVEKYRQFKATPKRGDIITAYGYYTNRSLWEDVKFIPHEAIKLQVKQSKDCKTVCVLREHCTTNNKLVVVRHIGQSWKNDGTLCNIVFRDGHGMLHDREAITSWS